MSLNVTFNGSMYIIPETGEVGWGGNTTSYLVAIAAGALQKTGGSFTLSAETDFGASFGIKSLYYKSRSANVAATGILRLNNNSDSISWRNAANSADLPLIVNTSDQLLYNGNQVLTGTGPSAYVSSITGTANQVIASAATGPVTLSLPQSINSTANVQFGTLGLGSAIVASSILSLTSTALGFLPPRMTTAQRDAIVSPATGLFIYNTDTAVYNYFNSSVWVAIAAGGTINAGTQYQLSYYATTGTTLSGLPLITALRALESDANGLPIASVTTATELSYVSGVTSAIQTQLNTKAVDTLVVHLAGTETITGTKTLNSFSGTLAANIAAATFKLTGLGAGTVAGDSVRYEQAILASGVNAFTANQPMGGFKLTGLGAGTTAGDSVRYEDVVRIADAQTITGQKTFNAATLHTAGTVSLPGIAFSADTDTGIRLPTGNSISLVTNATDRMGVDSAGNSFVTAGVLKFDDGSVSAPVMTFISDPDTGWYHIAADSFGAAANGTNVAIFSSAGVSILGTTTNDNAAAGYVGQQIESVISTFTNYPTSTQFGDLTSISLTAGDWDVSAMIEATLNGATLSGDMRFGISTTAGNSTTGLVQGTNLVNMIQANTLYDSPAVIPVYRISLTATTTVYLKYRAAFSAGTPQATGRISARRMR